MPKPCSEKRVPPAKKHIPTPSTTRIGQIKRGYTSTNLHRLLRIEPITEKAMKIGDLNVHASKHREIRYLARAQPHKKHVLDATDGPHTVRIKYSNSCRQALVSPMLRIWPHPADNSGCASPWHTSEKGMLTRGLYHSQFTLYQCNSL